MRLIALALFTSGIVFGQSFKAADVRIDAREVRPAPETTGRVLRGSRYELRHATMLDLVSTAYGVDADTVFGGPAWLQMDRYNVVAIAPEKTPRDQIKIMLQALLADRFQLTVHKDRRPLPAFALVAEKPKLKQVGESDEAACQTRSERGATPVLAVSCHNMSMAAFAQDLRGIANPFLNLPVTDRTELNGAWDFDFRFTPWSPTVTPESDKVTIFDALEKQLGLKLIPQKASAPVLVIDRVNRTPTPIPLAMLQKIPPSPLTEFEVAVIKPSLPDTDGDLKLLPGGQVDMRGITLKVMIALAWHLDPDTNETIVGAPKFLDSTRYDITAKPPAGMGRNGAPLDVDELSVLLRSLLQTRFRLSTHLEDRTVTAYTLIATKPKMKKADPDYATRWKEGPGPDGKDPRVTNPILNRLVSFQNVTAAQFAEIIPLIGSGLYTGPILDATGLSGSWDFTLSFSSAGLLRRAASGGESNGAVSIIDAIESQLGLKLEMRKRPLPVLVIDHVEEKPIDN
jgi:uncharacterized protein (TIGR03435 family)